MDIFVCFSVVVCLYVCIIGSCTRRPSVFCGNGVVLLPAVETLMGVVCASMPVCTRKSNFSEQIGIGHDCIRRACVCVRACVFVCVIC